MIKVIFFFAGFFSLLGFTTVGASERPEVSSLNCSVHSENQVQVQEGLRATLESRLLNSEGLIHCRQVQWQNQKFVAIQYRSIEYVSYSGSVRRVNRLQVYHWLENQLRPMLSHPINNFRPLWTSHRGYLLLRIRETNSKGHVELTTGYIFDPARRSFEDFIVFGMRQGWPDQELR